MTKTMIHGMTGTPLILERCSEATSVSIAARLGVQYRVFALENNGFTVTKTSAPEAGQRTLACERRLGVQTLARFFGIGARETIADTTTIDV